MFEKVSYRGTTLLRILMTSKQNCPNPPNPFFFQMLLNRHARHCGRPLLCGTCPSAFKDLETFQSHCRRKSHNPGTASIGHQRQVVVTSSSGGIIDLSTPALVTTAPSAAGRTCPGQLSAALAMAELSSVGIESVFHDESPANSRLKLTKAGK